MANFILIHGAMHGAWCWERVVPLLERQGHHVVAPDLPGMGKKALPTADVTLDAWSRFTVDLLNQQPGKSILVGHSLGGMVISQAAEAAPERIATLVYATALLPQNGLSAFDLTRGEDVPDRDARIDLNPTYDGQCITASPEGVRSFMYGETPAEWADLAASRVQPQPLEPLQRGAAITEAKFGAVPRIYIECLRDRIIPLSVQRAMHTASPCRTIYAIDTDHSPFYSTPEELAAILLKIAQGL